MSLFATVLSYVYLTCIISFQLSGSQVVGHSSWRCGPTKEKRLHSRKILRSSTICLFFFFWGGGFHIFFVSTSACLFHPWFHFDLILFTSCRPTLCYCPALIQTACVMSRQQNWMGKNLLLMFIIIICKSIFFPLFANLLYLFILKVHTV